MACPRAPSSFCSKKSFALEKQDQFEILENSNLNFAQIGGACGKAAIS